MHMNGEIFISPAGALSFLKASPATFGAADVSVSPIANIQPNVVELFPSRAAIAVALGQIGKSLRTVTGIVLSQSTVSCAHVRRDAAVQLPLQKLPVAVGSI